MISSRATLPHASLRGPDSPLDAYLRRSPAWAQRLAAGDGQCVLRPDATIGDMVAIVGSPPPVFSLPALWKALPELGASIGVGVALGALVGHELGAYGDIVKSGVFGCLGVVYVLAMDTARAEDEGNIPFLRTLSGITAGVCSAYAASSGWGAAGIALLAGGIWAAGMTFASVPHLVRGWWRRAEAREQQAVAWSMLAAHEVAVQDREQVAQFLLEDPKRLRQYARTVEVYVQAIGERQQALSGSLAGVEALQGADVAMPLGSVAQEASALKAQALREMHGVLDAVGGECGVRAEIVEDVATLPI